MKNFNPVNFDPESCAKFPFVRGLRYKEFSDYKNATDIDKILFKKIKVSLVNDSRFLHLLF